MAKIDITRTELVWPGKYDDDGNRREVPRVSLPFQVIETVNESRATREASKVPKNLSLFDVYDGKEGETFQDGWRNKLIWGDNLLVMGSLLEKFAGKVDLIYIDPPFATGADFSFQALVGEGRLDLAKEQSAIEEKAYRDTWGRGIDSFLDMLYPRLALAKQLLSSTGSIWVHIGPDVAQMVRLLMDDLFGRANCRGDVIWKRTSSHNEAGKPGNIHDYLMFYTSSDEWTWNQQHQPLDPSYVEKVYVYTDERGRYRLDNITGAGISRGATGQPWRGVDPTSFGRHWRRPPDELEQLLAGGRIQLKKDGKPSINGWKAYLNDSPGMPIQSMWLDIPNVTGISGEKLGYDTQKPEKLLDRIVLACSNPGDLVADFFCGSGTTLGVAEKLGRRYIGCDLGRFAVHTARKRLLEIENSKPFEVLNLGKYERQYWQTSTFGGAKSSIAEKALYEYLAFILKLYGAQPVPGLVHLHGKHGKAMVHVGAVDAPVTIDEINAAILECKQVKQTDLHVLGWEWEMGLVGLMVNAAKQQDIKLLLLQIPREVMEQQAVDKGDIQFFELAYLELTVGTPKKLTAQVTLSNFVIPNTELIPEDVRAKIKKWSDYIDYWAVDWDFQNDTFMQGWVNYRTRQDRTLALTSDAHTYAKPGRYRVLVKVVDIFGNDTSQAFDVEVR